MYYLLLYDGNDKPQDIAEYCNGSAAQCPPDKFSDSAGILHSLSLPHFLLDSLDMCLPAFGQCGIQIFCNGTSPTCPDRVFGTCLGGTCDIKSGACICANNQTVYPTCEEFCGDNTCNQKGVETCVNCPSDCPAPCGQCGDGQCSIQLENCNTCPSDCLSQCPVRQCTRDCINGQCSNGQCDCYGSYFGPTCAYKALPVSVSTQGAYPAIFVIVTTPSGDRRRFSISLVGIAEEGPTGNLVRSIDLSSTVFNVASSLASSPQSWTFSANITGYGYFTYAGVSGLARALGPQTANTLRMEVDLDSWAFLSAQNSLQIITENSIVDYDIDDCDVETSVFMGNVEWYLLHSDGIALYYELAQTATLDGYSRIITNGLVTDANTKSYIPFFWYNLSLTTTFGFIPDPNYTGCTPALHGSGGTKWEVYLSIPAVIILVVIVLIVIMFILRPARCFRRRRNVPSFDSKHPMVAVGSEMVILPPASPPPSEVPPPAPWQGDPRASTSEGYAPLPVGHMSMQFPPPPNQTYRPSHASSPYPQHHDHQYQDHHHPAPSAPLPSPDNNKTYINDGHHE